MTGSGPEKEPEDSEKVEVDSEVLNAFDPLALREEQSVWAEGEAHPPPVPPKPEEMLQPPAPDTPSKAAATSITPTFTSFASFARSFALPTLPNISLVSGTGPSSKSRPRSLDTATLMPTPVHPGFFAPQQQDKPLQSADEEDAEVSARGSPKRRALDHSQIQPEGSAHLPSTAHSRSRERNNDKDPPFDFQKFLDQMKSKSAEPVARYLRSFLSNFAKRTFTVTDQVKLINDFLNFISQKMREADVWRQASDSEFDNAMEGMEKLVMNRLYEFTFTPQIVLAVPPRAVTTDDLERDRVLSQRIALFGWIEPKHLDVPVGEGTNGFLMFAQQELVKINHYKAPRDKLICILNCCKVIFGLIRHLSSEESADTFVPILIFIVLKANPEHLLSNVEFINRFRNPEKLQSEAGYYLSSLMGAVSFIETMDHTSLSNITQEEFERNVEDAIQALPSSRSRSPPLASSSSSSSRSPSPSLPTTPSRPPAHPIPIPLTSSQPSLHAGEEPATPLSLPSIDARRLLQRTGDSLSKPLSAIGRIFSEALDGAEEALSSQFTPPQTPANPPQTPAPGQQGLGPPAPYVPRVRRISPSPSPSPSPLSHSPAGSINFPRRPPSHALSLSQSSQPVSRTGTPTAGLDIPGLQAEIDAAHVRAADAARGTLRQIFPTVDREVVEWVLEANDGDLGRSIEALLEISGGE
ncbi:hypothetical protein BV25DRAFT_1831100 [Artomyces pyxidatus]|uniref:Uncharacterized protein n=1 Tax=Artomyces pyxidatus TaxID=48021 RepID=A0ACB8SNH6_9AGAM|nr:hypothetical protein BV25DRAFT_1831100 [Artomyces pyxidatus]